MRTATLPYRTFFRPPLGLLLGRGRAGGAAAPKKCLRGTRRPRFPAPT